MAEPEHNESQYRPVPVANRTTAKASVDVPGASIKYFLISTTPEETILGCLLFSSSVWHLKDRDNWIGWDITRTAVIN